MFRMCDRKLTESTYPVLHIGPRLKPIFAKGVRSFAAMIISRGNHHGTRSLDRGTYRLLDHCSRSVPHNFLRRYFDSTLRAEQTRLISARIRTVGLHAGSNSSELHWLPHV